MASIRLSARAASDLRRIASYGIETFGVEAARRYRDGLKASLARIAEAPLRFPGVDHIRPGYRRCVFQSRSIYFKVDGEDVLVVRILGREDPESSFQ